MEILLGILGGVRDPLRLQTYLLWRSNYRSTVTTGQQIATHVRSNTCYHSEGRQDALLFFSDEQTREEIYGLLLLLPSKVAVDKVTSGSKVGRMYI